MLTNPYEPVLNESIHPPRDWTFALVSMITSTCLALTLSNLVMWHFPATQPLILPRVDSGLLFANPIIFLSTWYYDRRLSGLWAASFMCLMLALLIGHNLFKHGTVAVVNDWNRDRLHSAWLWTVALPLVFAGVLAMLALTAKRKQGRIDAL